MSDIEILENCWLMKTNHVLDEENKKVRQAIENLIKENKKLKKQIGKDLDVIYLKGVYDERDKWKNKVKEVMQGLNRNIVAVNDNSSKNYKYAKKMLQELLEEGE